MSKLLPVVRGWGWSYGPPSFPIDYHRKVEPIVEILDKHDYNEERDAERMYRVHVTDVTYNKGGKLNYVCKGSGRRLSIKV